MPKQILGTFQSRDAADSVKDAFMKEGFNAADLIVMSNVTTPEPPEAATLEVGAEGAKGFAGFEESIGKAVLSVMGKPAGLDGDGFEGDATGGALLGVTISNDADEARVRALLQRHFAADIEVAQRD